MTIRRAAERLREVGSIPVLAAALLIVAGSAYAGGDRSQSRGNSGGGGRTAQPRSSSPSSGGGSHGSSSPSHSGSSGGHSTPRVGVPSGSGGNDHDGRPNRQPPTRHDHGGGRGGHGGGYYGGGYYGGYYPYGYWPRAFFGWYWDDYYWREPYPYGYGYGHGYGRERSREDMGALDLDLSPGRTEVFLDGQNIGTVDDFDGWPQYLWLPKGTYDIAFYLDGYKTLARQVTVYPGLVIDMDDRMEQGASVRPEELQPRTHERRDDRIGYERDRAERIDRGEWDARRRDDDNWRDRPRRDRDRHEQDEQEIEDDSEGRAVEATPGGDAGWLKLDIQPDDASVYLDGRFVGTARELASMQRGLRVDAGEHHLAVVRPGREPEERDFDLDAGQEMALDIELDTE
jgi:hypothetical protein